MPEPEETMGWSLPALVATAYVGLAGAFLGPRHRFFTRMTATGAGLAIAALASDPALRRLRPSVASGVQGGAIASLLYGVFRVGDRLSRRVIPKGGQQIDDLYGLAAGHRAVAVAARLALVIGPSEELFWRGLVQRRLTTLLGGKGWGALAGTAAYTGAHLATGNPPLVLGAAVAGGWWATLSARGVSMEVLIISHVAWDILIFLVAPTSRGARGVSVGRRGVAVGTTS